MADAGVVAAAALSSPHLLRSPATVSISVLRLSLVGDRNPNRLRTVPRRTRPLFSSVIRLRRSPSSSLTSSSSSVEAESDEDVSESDGDVSESEMTLRRLCHGHVPDHVLRRMEEIGFIFPTDVQREALPVLFSGRDCIIHAQTGSGKTLTYLLLIHSVINSKRSAVQAVIVVPTRELGTQVTKVARMLTVKSEDLEPKQKTCTVMALLDGGMLKRQRAWLKAEPPNIVVATLPSLCQMLEKHAFNLNVMQVLVIDEVDSIFSSSSQVSSLRKLLTTFSSSSTRQTLFASASIPQHRRFMHDCIKQKWTKDNVVHIHVNPVEPIPPRIQHRYMACPKDQRDQTLVSLLQSDAPKSAIIFVNEQSEKLKNTDDMPTSTALVDILKNSLEKYADIVVLDEDMNFNSRAASLADVRLKESYLLVATDLAGRGLDLPETTHIYNYDLPKSAVHYLHRAGRTARKPFADSQCIVTSIIVPEERFVLARFENELRFDAEELLL